MALKRAKFITFGNDEQCLETQKFIEDAGVLLDIRDIEKNPLSADELGALYGHCDMRHFLDRMSKSYAKHGLDQELPEREQLLELMATDQTLIRRPIIKSMRLMTVGCDKKKIAEMLQIGRNGSGNNDEPKNTRHSARAETAGTGK